MLCRQPSRNSVGAGSFPYLSHSDGYETRIKASVKDASLRVKVSYAVSAALSAVGDNRLLPSPQNSVLVINMKSGYVRQNQSYVISRIFRDYDYWKDPQIDKAETQRLADLQQLEDDTARIEKRDPVKVRMGLRLAIYEATEKSGSVKQDNLWRSGIIVVLVQLGIAAVPWAIHEEWLTFFVTGVGTLLALASGALPQWAEEKWACRRKSDKTVVLTSGNGAHDAIVVIGNGRGFDLEDLGSSYRLPGHPNQTRILSLVLAVAWVALLVCVAGYRQHTWYLLGVGGIGIIHNIVIAGAPRKPSSFGIHLLYRHTIVDRKVMGVLALAEAQYPRLGLSLLTTFFPGDLGVREQRFWAYARRRAHAYTDDGKVHPMPDLNGNEDIPGDGWLT
jgi:hypothetical protein